MTSDTLTHTGVLGPVLAADTLLTLFPAAVVGDATCEGDPDEVLASCFWPGQALATRE